MAGLYLKNISKRFSGNVDAVTDFTLNIEDKEFVVLVGSSGCGKTTVLRMIAGLETPSSGEIYIGGELVNNKAPKDRDIAMVFQNYALYPHMTVFENMAFGLSLRKIPKNEIRKKVYETAEMLGIKELLDKRPRHLSGGQCQRAALGRALIRQPKVFLMDEPLSNLDAKLRIQMRNEICKLHKEIKTTFVYVTHDQEEAMTMGTRLVVMKDGYIQQADTPINIYERPSNTFVASFIGNPQINFIDGILDKSNGRLYFSANGSSFALTGKKSAAAHLEDYIEKNITAGIRPEHIFLKNDASGSGCIRGTVELVEYLGKETYIHVAGSNNLGFKVRADSKTGFSIGDSVHLSFNPDDVYLFDKQNGQLII